MPVVTVQDVKDAYDVASQIASTRLNFCLDNANRKVRRLIGTDYHTRAFATPVASTDTDLASDATEAVIKLTMAEVLVNANLRIRPSGQVIKEQDAASPAMGRSAQIVNEYLTPEQVDAWRDRLISDALSLISPWTLEGTGGMGTIQIASPAY